MHVIKQMCYSCHHSSFCSLVGELEEKISSIFPRLLSCIHDVIVRDVSHFTIFSEWHILRQRRRRLGEGSVDFLLSDEWKMLCFFVCNLSVWATRIFGKMVYLLVAVAVVTASLSEWSMLLALKVYFSAFSALHAEFAAVFGALTWCFHNNFTMLSPLSWFVIFNIDKLRNGLYKQF